ncbi:MAG: polysaccharide biosynthesis tyrosine autokinase [Cellvibrionaceae bacterium]|nr:polysaccharide biosynthesis tyrosine autokinase [Cellvibrionaceae bacterium]
MKAVTTTDHTTPLATPAHNDADTEEIIDLSQYWRTIVRHKWGILSVTLVCAVIGSLLAIAATPIFRAAATIQADPTQPSVDPRENYQYVNSALVLLFYETQYEIIRSRNVAESVVDKLNLVAKHKAKAAQAKQDSQGSISSTLKSWLPTAQPTTQQTAPTSDAQLRIQLANAIRANLQVQGGKQSQIITISYESPDAQEATAIVNAVADVYIQQGLASRLGDNQKEASYLEGQLSSVKAKLEASESELQSYRQKTGLVETSQQQRIANTQLQALNNELVRAQTHFSEAGIRYSKAQALKSQAGNYNSLSEVLNSKIIQDMIREEARLRRKVEELWERYGEKHPKMIAARSDLASAESNLQREVGKIAESIGEEYRAAAVQVRNIKTLIEQQKSELSAVQNEHFTLNSLEREVENNRQLYETLLNRIKEYDVSGSYDASNIRIIDTATLPNAPFKPNKKLYFLLAVFIGLASGVGLAFLREALDTTFKTPEALEEKLQTPYLGLTQQISNPADAGKPEAQYFNDTRSTFAESINTIRTGLLLSHMNTPLQSILITSSKSSEGKSTLAINLAAALSQMGSTLLLEADLRKPSIAKYMNIRKPVGLCDVVAGQVKLNDALSTMVKNTNLYILPCGTTPPNPLHLLSSQQFLLLLKQLKEQFKYIVIDSPPILPVSDAAVLGNLSDAVIMAVKAEETSHKVAKEAVNRLTKNGVNITGCVLTQAEPQRMSDYGEHYSEAYYGYGASDPQLDKTRGKKAQKQAVAA